MKLRYFLATLLFLCIFCYGAIVLVTAMINRSAIPFATGQTVQSTAVADSSSPAATVNAPSTIDTAKARKSVSELQENSQEFNENSNTLPAVERAVIPQKPTQWGEATRGIVHRVNVRSQANTKTLFLTINAYSANQEELIQTLINHNIKATFFVSGYYVRRNPETVKQLAVNPLFDVENLGNRSRALSVEGKSAYGIAGTNNVEDALKEVADGAASIAAVTGKKPKFFRSFTGYTDDVAVAAVNATGTKVIGYQIVTDGNGKISSEEITNRILQADNGSILIISINPDRPHILKGLQDALEEIKAQKLPLKFEKLIGYETAFEIIR